MVGAVAGLEAGGWAMRGVKAIAVCTVLYGCCSAPPTVPAQIVKVPVPVPCDALGKLKPAPKYPTTEQYRQAGGDIARLSQLATVEILMRREREKELLAALAACANDPTAPKGKSAQLP